MTQVVNSYTEQWKRYKRKMKHNCRCGCNYCKAIRKNKKQYTDLSKQFRGMTLEEYYSSK